MAGASDDGTAFLEVAGGAKLGFQFTVGTHFDLISFEVAESAPGTGPVSLHAVGYGSMGLMVTNDFATDGINDGTGPLRDFQTITLDNRFQDLYRVDISGGWFSLDNVVLGGVPEPTTTSLVLIGTMCVWWFRRPFARPTT